MFKTPPIASGLAGKYLDQTAQIVQEARQEKEKLARAGLPEFECNVETWLDLLLPEIQDITDATYRMNRDGSFTYETTFHWEGFEGAIKSGPWGLRWKIAAPGGAWLKISIFNFHGQTDPQSIKLPGHIPTSGSGEYTEKALPVDASELGAFLLKVAAKVKNYDEGRRLRNEHYRREVLQSIENKFQACLDIPDVQKYLGEISVSHPAENERWLAAANRRSLEITRELEAKRAAENYAALETTEELRLAEEAASLFRPFTVYRLKLAIKLPDDDQVYFTHTYTTAAVPDETGWYTQVDRGELRTYRPESLVDVTRLEIDSVDHPDAPNVCRRVEISSEEIPLLTEVAFATPEGLG